MAEKLRVRCPICGSMPDLDQLVQTEKKWPAKLMLYLQKFGGKVPVTEPPSVEQLSKKKKMGGAPGYMEYIDITAESESQLAKIKVWFDKRVQEYLKGG